MYKRNITFLNNFVRGIEKPFLKINTKINF